MVTRTDIGCGQELSIDSRRALEKHKTCKIMWQWLIIIIYIETTSQALLDTGLDHNNLFDSGIFRHKDI